MNKFKNYLLDGLRDGLIKNYDAELILKLRDIYYMGFPASLLLLMKKVCDHKCYDMADLLSMGLDDFEIVSAKIELLKEADGNDERAGHCWVESNDWVYDTSMRLMIEKKHYYKMNQIKKGDTRIKTKEDCLRHPEYVEILCASDKEHAFLRAIHMSYMELAIKEGPNQKYLEAELERFKKQIDFENEQKNELEMLDDKFNALFENVAILTKSAGK